MKTGRANLTGSSARSRTLDFWHVRSIRLAVAEARTRVRHKVMRHDAGQSSARNNRRCSG